MPTDDFSIRFNMTFAGVTEYSRQLAERVEFSGMTIPEAEIAMCDFVDSHPMKIQMPKKKLNVKQLLTLCEKNGRG